MTTSSETISADKSRREARDPGAVPQKGPQKGPQKRARAPLGTTLGSGLLAGAVLFAGAALLATAVTLPAFAALGGDATSVDADAAKMKGQARATPAGGYTVKEITLPSGTLLREYVSPGGKVFAVTWIGMTPPDLQQTLGTYFERYKAAAAAPHATHHHLIVHQPDFVLNTGGHMRAWTGKAYVPDLLPPNFSVDDIK